jgi:hypothetical protein
LRKTWALSKEYFSAGDWARRQLAPNSKDRAAGANGEYGIDAIAADSAREKL